MKDDVKNIIFVGTGGQGIVSASRILAWSLFKSGYEVKASEIHGMAQRGGTVFGFLRFGKKVNSPQIPKGTGDLMIALEEMEALRYLPYLKEGALVILNRKRVIPSSLDPAQYPQDVVDRLQKKGYKVIEVFAEERSKVLGSSKVENVYLLGVVSPLLPIKEDVWKEVISRFFPKKVVDLNIKAFDEGRKLGEELLQSQN